MTTNEFHSHVDRIIKKSKIPNCCSKGCSHCCSEALYCDRREAEHALAAVPPEQLEGLKERTKTWLERATPILGKHLPDGYAWRLVANAPCPFLVDGLCSVYDRRPVGCRVFFARENPDNCKVPAREHQQVSSYTDESMARLCMPFFVDQPTFEMDHLGCFLAEKLLGTHPDSANHTIYVQS